MISGQQDYYKSLADNLRKLPAETEWLEYKSNNTDSQMIGEYISALSNSAALAGKEKGYLINIIYLFLVKIASLVLFVWIVV